MIDFILTAIFTTQILGSQDFNLEILDPRTVLPKSEEEKKDVKKEVEPQGKLTLTLSSDFIDFGMVKPTSPVIRETTLLAENSGSLPYSLIAFEDQPPRASFAEAAAQAEQSLNEAGPPQNIPDTTCDDGTCRENLSSQWINPLAYGFGFSLSPPKYQQFANEEAGETKQSLAKGKNSQEIKINYKLNVSKMQANGFYTNKITYLLVPDF